MPERTAIELERRAELQRKLRSIGQFVLLLVVLGIIYIPAFDAPMIFDSRTHIEDNQRIQDLSSGKWFTGRRWFSYFTLALDYQIYRGNEWGYHLTNTLIHFVSALFLWGIVSRTLRFHTLDRFTLLRSNANLIAYGTAIVWAVHPLQTQSVIYTVQRMESLMGLFLFASLYGFVRSASSTRPLFWLCLSVACCYLSAFNKEVAVAVPFVVLLYDFVFTGISAGDVSAGDKSENESNLDVPETDSEHSPNTGRPSNLNQVLSIGKKRWLYYLAMFGVVLLFSKPLGQIANFLGRSNQTVATGESRIR